MYTVSISKNIIVATKVNSLEKHLHLSPERVINLSAGSTCDRVRYVCAELQFLFAFCWIPVWPCLKTLLYCIAVTAPGNSLKEHCWEPSGTVSFTTGLPPRNIFFYDQEKSVGEKEKLQLVVLLFLRLSMKHQEDIISKNTAHLQ